MARGTAKLLLGFLLCFSAVLLSFLGSASARSFVHGSGFVSTHPRSAVWGFRSLPDPFHIRYSSSRDEGSAGSPKQALIFSAWDLLQGSSSSPGRASCAKTCNSLSSFRGLGFRGLGFTGSGI